MSLTIRHSLTLRPSNILTPLPHAFERLRKSVRMRSGCLKGNRFGSFDCNQIVRRCVRRQFNERTKEAPPTRSARFDKPTHISPFRHRTPSNYLELRSTDHTNHFDEPADWLHLNNGERRASSIQPVSILSGSFFGTKEPNRFPYRQPLPLGQYCSFRKSLAFKETLFERTL